MQANNKKGGNKLPKSIQIGYLQVPEDYFKLHSIDKETVCVMVMNDILDIIDKQLPQHINRLDFLDKVLDSTIVTNLEEEEYLIVQVLTDIKQLING
jgi:hypothetical protein